MESIHRKWKVDDVVKMTFEGHLSMSMNRSQDLLEVHNSTVHVCLRFFNSMKTYSHL